MYAIANDVSFYLPLAETVAPSWQMLHERFVLRGKRRGADEVDELRLIREGHAARIWLRVGEPGYAAYLERVLGYDPRTARERITIALALGELSEIEAALANGELSYSAVRELVRVTVAETEKAWLAKARGKTLREVERMVSGREKGNLPDAPSRPENIRHHLHYRDVPAATLALERQTKRAFEEEVGHALDDAEFLHMAFERALSPGESSTERRAPHQIANTLCECGRAWQDAGGTLVEIDKTAIAIAECDAERIGSLDAKTPARASQDVSPATRRLLFHRDENRCQVVGCRASRFLHVHHIDARKDGGGSELDNLVLLCGEHHRAYHEGKVRQIVTEDGELRFEHVMMQAPPMVIETATRALVGLGFKKKEAEMFVADAMTHVGRDSSVGELVKEALRRSPRPKG